MKKFVGISSILLLSSVLANTGVSLASASETKEEAKVVDTTKEKNEKKSSSDDASDSSTEEKMHVTLLLHQPKNLQQLKM